VWAYQQATGRTDIFRGTDSWQNDTTMETLHAHGTEPVAAAEMRPGDIVFITSTEQYVTHGGLFVQWISEDRFEFVNSSGYHNAVVRDEWPADGQKREQWFVGGGRLRLPQ
jgi:hypothetical protein